MRSPITESRFAEIRNLATQWPPAILQNRPPPAIGAGAALPITSPCGGWLETFRFDRIATGGVR
jgi:hypothetical protein